MQHLRSIRSYRQRGRLDWAVHGQNWMWKISEKGCLLWATKFKFISILTDRMVLIIPFSFSRPRDTWQAASTQTVRMLEKQEKRYKVTPQSILTCLQILKIWLLRTHIKVQDWTRGCWSIVIERGLNMANFSTSQLFSSINALRELTFSVDEPSRSRRRNDCFYNQVRFFFNFNFTPNW